MKPDISRASGAKMAVLGVALVFGASEAAQPLIKSGACPELVRDTAAWLNSSDARGRFITNNSGTFTLKSNPGTIQVALTPAQSINCSQVPTGFKAEMWASELDTTRSIISVQAFSFDERGRMWAVETFDYPNNLKSPFAGNDRIVILEDTDGDRVMDKRTVFAGGLNIPQGIEITPQGVVVAMAPYLLLFKDDNNDDEADSSGRIIYAGFSKGDTHGAVNNLKYGLDNWLYGDVGYNGGTVNGTGFGAGIWRVRLDTNKFEFVSSVSGGNSAGFGMMEDGQLFASAATGGGNTHSQHGVLPGVAANLISSYGNGFVASTVDLVQGDQFRGFTAASGHEIYTARLFPQAYWSRAAFVTDGTGHLVNVDFLDTTKSTWKANRAAATPNIFASTDAWTAPLFAKVGPDGALWVLDWYTYVYLHNGMASSVQGPGAAWINPLRTRTRERIYRVSPDDGRLDPVLDLRNYSYAQLVETFKNPNMFWRLSAQKQILKKAVTVEAKAQVEPLLLNALKSRARDTVGLDAYALHALWTARGLGLFSSNAAKWDSVLRVLLLHPSPAVRMNVPRAMLPTAASVQAIKDQGRVNDPDTYVRLWTLIGLSNMPKLDGIELYTPYKNVDTYSTQAFTKANASAGAGVTETAALPSIPALEAAVSVRSRPSTINTNRLHFIRDRDGWRPVIDGRVSAGELSLYNLRGVRVDRVSYDGAKWSAGLRAGNEPLYVFVYQGVSGERFEGRLLRASGR